DTVTVDSKYIHEHKQAQPDDVHEVPVPGDSFETEMVIGTEMPLETTQQNHGKHDRAQRHMQTVKAGQHEKGRTIHARTQHQAQVLIGLDILGGLEVQETGTQCDCRQQNAAKLGAAVL